MIHDLYAANHRQRREQALLEANCQCQRCPTRFGVLKVSRAFNLKFETPHLHHPNGDPENPDAEVIILCDACHMRAHRQRGKENEKAAPRKAGYEVIRGAVLLERLAGMGLRTWSTENGRMAWQLGDLTGEAADSLDVVLTAFHWLEAEVRSLADKLEQVKPTL